MYPAYRLLPAGCHLSVPLPARTLLFSRADCPQYQLVHLSCPAMSQALHQAHLPCLLIYHRLAAPPAISRAYARPRARTLHFSRADGPLFRLVHLWCLATSRVLHQAHLACLLIYHRLAAIPAISRAYARLRARTLLFSQAYAHLCLGTLHTLAP